MRSPCPLGESWAHRAPAGLPRRRRLLKSPRPPCPEPPLGLELSPLLPDLRFALSPFPPGSRCGE